MPLFFQKTKIKNGDNDSSLFPYPLGALQSPTDERDFQFGTRSSIKNGLKSGPIEKRNSLPTTLDLRKKLPSIIDQGSKSSCVACVGACIKEYQERIDCGYNGHFSPDYIYFYRENKPYDGMWPRDMMKILQKRGCCSNYKLPYDKKVEPTVISTGCDRDAANYKVGTYYQLNTVDELKEALYENGPCCITFNVYNKSKQMWKQEPGDKYHGSHAMTVVGYKNDKFIIRNSWGKDWGNKGYTEYKFKDFGAHLELWTCADQRGSSKIKYDNDDRKKKKKNDDKKSNHWFSKIICC